MTKYQNEPRRGAATHFQYISYLWPLLASAAITLTLMVYGFRPRTVRASLPDRVTLHRTRNERAQSRAWPQDCTSLVPRLYLGTVSLRHTAPCRMIEMEA